MFYSGCAYTRETLRDAVGDHLDRFPGFYVEYLRWLQGKGYANAFEKIFDAEFVLLYFEELRVYYGLDIARVAWSTFCAASREVGVNPREFRSNAFYTLAQIEADHRDRFQRIISALESN